LITSEIAARILERTFAKTIAERGLGVTVFEMRSSPDHRFLEKIGLGYPPACRSTVRRRRITRSHVAQRATVPQ
jgi:hypothetical protein